jgi:hypothetical protein
MRQFWFEIVPRSFDRYGWLFVGLKQDRRRVLARSGRDYRSPDKARDAIVALQEMAAFVPIVEAGSTADEPLPLPATSFAFVSGVLPLVVREFPFEEDAEVGRRRKGRRRDQAGRDREGGEPVVVMASSAQPAAQETVAEAAVAEPSEPSATPEPEPEPKPKRRSGQGGRRQKGS